LEEYISKRCRIFKIIVPEFDQRKCGEIMKFLSQERLFPATFLKRYVPNMELETLTVAQLVKKFPSLYGTEGSLSYPSLVPVVSYMNPAHTVRVSLFLT
jgi:hypothetical protein